jgi:hypothetical protein
VAESVEKCSECDRRISKRNSGTNYFEIPIREKLGGEWITRSVTVLCHQCLTLAVQRGEVDDVPLFFEARLDPSQDLRELCTNPDCPGYPQQHVKGPTCP